MREAEGSISVLHLDDCPFAREQIAAALTARGTFVVEQAEDLDEALGLLARHRYDLLLLDVDLGGERDSIDEMATFRRHSRDAAIVSLSDSDDLGTMKRAFDAGVFDFVCKDQDAERLADLIGQAYLSFRAKQSRVDSESSSQSERSSGAGRSLSRIKERVPRIIASAITGVHIHGESGTGKEVVAELFREANRTKPFLAVNCAAIAPTLLESTLFGSVKGAFTGALQDRQGILEAASGGFLFLDEVACLTMPAQASLLRAIESQEITRVGDHRSIKICVRILSATNENLKDLVAQGRFRRDLWQRLCEAEIKLAPLRQRRDEIPALVEHFLSSMAGGPYRIAPAAMKILCELQWEDGNVRQLRNCLRAMTERHVDRMLSAQSVPRELLLDEGAKNASTPHAQGTVVLPLPNAPALDFELLTLSLFIKLIQRWSEVSGRLSLRQLERRLEMSKSSVSRRLWEAVNQKVIDVNTLNLSVRLGPRKDEA